jgi:hypothetical protein
VIACIALAVALGGTSYAALRLPANSVGSTQIKNRSIQRIDISRRTIASLRGLRGPRGLTGRQGAQGPPGAQGAQGIQGIPGTARAYGRVSQFGAVSRSKNVVSVTNPATGIFCITLDSSIDPATTGLVVSPDFVEDSTSFFAGGNESIAEWNSDSIDCPAGRLEVMTGYRTQTSTGSPDGDIRAVNNVAENESFFFVVP